MRFLHTVVIILISFSYCIAGPKLKLLNAPIQLGEIYRDSVDISFKFNYTNLGDSPLYLVEVSAFCPCIKTQFSEEALIPGDTASISVSYSPEYPGFISQAIRIFYNSDDPETSVPAFFYADVIERKEEE